MFDYQKQRVYDWENEFFRERDRMSVPYSQVQSLVNYIWDQEGWKYPPIVTPMAKQERKAFAKANRGKLFIREEGAPTWVILHELSHSLTISFDGLCSTKGPHGPDFVGMYMKLIEKYMKVPLPLLMFTAKQANVDFNILVKPIFME